MEKPASFYLALAASTISSVGWLAALFGAVALFVITIRGETSTEMAWLVILGLVTGVIFARLERRIHTVE